jgi:virginiamycin B lyase
LTDIADGWDGSLWVMHYSSQVGHLTSSGYRGYQIGTENNSYGHQMTLSGDGALWFTEFGADRIGHLDPSTGQLVEYPLARYSGPGAIVPALDGGVWFTELTADRIGHMAPGGKLTEYSPSPADSGPYSVAVDARGNVWYAHGRVNKIGRISPSGELIEYAVPGSDPQGGKLGSVAWITAHPNGSMYFVTGDHGVGRIDQDGTITVKALHEDGDDATYKGYPTDSQRPHYQRIVAGPDGQLWFTARSPIGAGGEVERITPDLGQRQILYSDSARLTLNGSIIRQGNAVWAPLEDAAILRFDSDGTMTRVPVCR